MTLFERILQNAEAIRDMGAQAIAEARRRGVPSYYVDPALGDGIVREMPDGTKQLIRTGGKTDDDGKRPGSRA